MKQFYTWRTSCIIRETKEAVTIIFDPGNASFVFKAGQFINISLFINGERVTRSYSLSSSTDEDEYPAITVKEVDDGLMSSYIVTNAEEITEWEVEGPHGFFYADEKALQKKQIVSIGGGSGITPLYSQLKYFLKHTDIPVLLINCNRFIEDVIFQKSLHYLEHSFSHRLKTWYVFSGRGNDYSFFHHHLEGGLNKLVLKKLLKKELGEALNDAAFFLCGPNGLIEMAEETLNTLSIPTGNVYKEYFGGKENKKTPVALPQQTLEVLFHHMEQSNLLEVEPGKTILEAALENGIVVNYSCKKGTCGTCVAKVLEGQVYMASNFALQQEHIDNGYVLLCQTHPLNNSVTVETVKLN